MELIVMSLITNEENCVEAVEILNTENHQLIQVSPYQLLVGIELNNAPVVNATTALNSVTVCINGACYRLPVRVPNNIKEMIRNKREADKKQRRREKAKEMSTPESKKKAEINKVLVDYREREEERRRKMREQTKGFAKPGELTDEERRRRREEYFRKRREANNK